MIYMNFQYGLEPVLIHFFFNFSKVPEADGLIPVNLNLINDLWVPNVFIYNLKSFQVRLIALQTRQMLPDKDLLDKGRPN